MSLGFNTMRAPRVTNLPGSVGASIIMRNPQQRPRSKRVDLSETRLANRVMKQVDPSMPRLDGNRSVPLKETRYESAVVENDECATTEHAVWATVSSTLVEVGTEDEIATDQTRVYMVYPMRKETDERVSMRVKTVNSVTGQLYYTWVIVFDPVTDERFLHSFSLTP